MPPEIPPTTAECDGCDEELNLLTPHLQVQLKAGRKVLVIEEEQSEDPNEDSVSNIFLGDKTGRGVLLKFHGFDCVTKYATKRKGKEAKIEFHHEDEIYEPEDNRTLKEQVKDGDQPKEALALAEARERVADETLRREEDE